MSSSSTFALCGLVKRGSKSVPGRCEKVQGLEFDVPTRTQLRLPIALLILGFPTFVQTLCAACTALDSGWPGIQQMQMCGGLLITCICMWVRY